MLQHLRRIPRHLGVIPDGNRRWADALGLPREAGYDHGIDPGIRLIQACGELGIEEVSVYGFTKENVRRPARQVAAFREACVAFAERILTAGAALRVVGDTESSAFPPSLRHLAGQRSAGGIRVNLLVNYGWQWDLAPERSTEAAGAPPRPMRSADIPRIDLVLRWGGRSRLSGFLPVQCAYADLHVIDTLWPQMQLEELHVALQWYQVQDVTLGG